MAGPIVQIMRVFCMRTPRDAELSPLAEVKPTDVWRLRAAGYEKNPDHSTFLGRRGASLFERSEGDGEERRQTRYVLRIQNVPVFYPPISTKGQEVSSNC